MTTETPVLDHPEVRVTNTKVTVRGTTYFLPNITSVKINEEDTMRSLGYAVGLAGVIMAIVGISDANVALAIAGFAAVPIALAMYKYGRSWDLILTTGAAEQQAFRSSDKALIVRVRDAINVAVERRMT